MASEIVIGIDFGTTHSGISWAVNGGNKNVRLITDWPNAGSPVASTDKVPTIISYRNGQVHTWGSNVEITEPSFKWFKILLDPNHKFRYDAEPAVTSSKLLSSLDKTVDDVATDYLRLIWEYAKDDIRRVKGDNWQSIYSLKVVLTVPAIWSPAAKERTKKVAKAAGLPEKVSLVTEPEAAALAVLKEKNDEDASLQPGDGFVVCDAGGGTVDLISYKVTGIDPLHMEECAIGEGGLCGSVCVDAAFEKYIKTIVGERNYGHMREKAKKFMLREFEMSVKRRFTGDNKEYSVDLRGVEDNPEEGIEDDTIKLKPNVLKTVFDHVINQIIELVEKQIDQVQERGFRVKAILLVGGFGTSKYMYQRLRSAHNGDGIQVLQVNGAWSAICRGATLWGLENSERNTCTKKTVTARIARYSYGISCAVPFDPSAGHLSIDRTRFPHGEWRAINQMDWILQKGDRVEEGRVIRKKIAAIVQISSWRPGVQKFSQELHYCADDPPPSRMETSVKELCTVQYGIEWDKLRSEESYKDPETKKKWKDAVFDLEIVLDSATIRFVVFYKGERVAYTEAKYKEDF